MLYFLINIDQESDSEFLWYHCTSVPPKQWDDNVNSKRLYISQDEYEYLLDRDWVLHTDKGLAIDESGEDGENGRSEPIYDHVTDFCFAVKMILRRYGLEHIFDNRNIESGYCYPLDCPIYDGH